MSKSKINIDQLELEVARTLDKYAVMTYKVASEVVEQTAKDTVARLKELSPKNRGNYAKTWKYDKSQIKRGLWRFSTVVYNSKNYRLTHLLEYGHDIVNKKGERKGRTDAQPHISTAEEIAKEEMVNNMIDALSNIGFD